MPTASLFRTTPGPTTGYLVETDPRFTNYRQWLSSDALLTALSYDPATVQKRLGDGFYEQQLIREQVAELTGHRFLTGYSSDEAQYQALIASGVTYAQAWNLIPGIALTAAQMAQLTTDMVWLVEQTVTLADGSTQQVLVPQLYAVVCDGDLSDTGALLSGGSVNINLSGDLTNSGTIAGRSVVSLTADNVQNLGGRITGRDVAVQAATDLNNIGGQISAGNSLLVTAGRDINIETTTRRASSAVGANSFSRTTLDRIASLVVTTPGGTLVASAGRDLNLVAASIGHAGADGSTTPTAGGITPTAGGTTSTAGGITLSAGRNLNLATVTTAQSDQIVWDAKNRLGQSSSTEVGTTVQGAAAVRLAAGADLTARAATVQATGALVATAGNDLLITAGVNTQSLDEAHQHTSKGFLSKKTITTQDQLEQSTAAGSSFGGASVTAVAGRDLTVQGSNLVSDTGTTLVAGNNLAIVAATDQASESHFREEKKSGLMGSGGIGFTIGKTQLSTDAQQQSTTAAASTVAALSGGVTLLAGNQYTQTGSNVLATGVDGNTAAANVTIQAQDVAITEARETTTGSTVTKQSSSGLTVSLGSPLVSAAQTVQGMARAAGQTQDARMQALAGANVGLAGYNAVQDIAKNGGKPGVDVSLSFGSSSNTSTTTDQSNAAAGSTVAAGGNVSIVATGTSLTTGTGTGNPGKGEVPLPGNILIQGSSVSAGGTVTFQAANDLLLQAARSTSSEQSSSQGRSASLGVSVGTCGLNVTASASKSKSKGQGDGADLTYSNTAVSAGKTVNLQSGRDTLLAGATIAADAVRAQVGRDLTIQSLQDQSSYRSTSASSGGSNTIGSAPSVSASVSKTKVDSDFQSVGTQSGIPAGDGGFQVAVKGDATLTGGVISSTQAAVDAGVNRFATEAR